MKRLGNKDGVFVLFMPYQIDKYVRDEGDTLNSISILVLKSPLNRCRDNGKGCETNLETDCE
jgi:hypothetical protein